MDNVIMGVCNHVNKKIKIRLYNGRSNGQRDRKYHVGWGSVCYAMFTSR